MIGRHSRLRSRALSSSILRPLLGAVMLGVVALSASPAWSQEDQESEPIVVTGSRIRTPLAQEEPITTIGQQQIDQTGLSSTADVLQRIPLSGGGLNTRFNSSGNFGNPPDGGGVGAGAAEVDLRYLGSPRVLVLVDGLRWVNGASASGVPGSVDLNTIPSGMIDRIEVLQQGASPIYGSDAIAGVVNIITRREQDGFEGSAQYGGYFDDGDGETQEYNASYGFHSNNTDIVFGASYVNQEPILAADRDIALFPEPGATSCLAGGCSSGTPLGRFIIHDPNTNQDLDMTLVSAFPPGGFPTYNPANPTGPGEDFKDFTDLDRFNFQPYNYVLTPSERFSTFAQATFELPHQMELRVRGSYVNRQSANQAAPLPLFVGPDAGNGNLLDTVVISAANPYNPFGFDLGPGTLAFVGRRLVEAGPRHYEQDVDSWNLTGTLAGSVQVGARTWDWDVNAVWASNRADQTFTGNVNALNVVTALGPSCTGSCVPLNIFGGAGSITPAMLNYIGFVQHDSSEQNLQDYSANITGDILDMPAGPLSFAAGIEHRHTDGRFDPDPIVAAGFSSDIPAQPAQGEIEVQEIYAEFRIPLVADKPFMQELTASIAGRAFDYSTSGEDQTFQAGLRWRPTSEMLFRINWGEGFRAPSIGELYGTASRFDQEVRDPCSDFLGLNGGPVQSGTVQGNCITNGVPAGGTYVQLNPQVPVITSGNVNLEPETSESWNLGFVWQPSFLSDRSWTDRVTFEVNYADITLDGAIKAQDGQSLLDRCAQTGDALACSTITRTGTGTISGIANPLINIGGIEETAVDLTIDWQSPDWSFGTFSVRSTTYFLLEFNELVPTATGIVAIPREGTERGSPDQAYPDVKSTLTVNWELGQWGATLTGRYISEVDEPAGVDNTLEAITYLDAQLRWRPAVLDDNIVLAVGVNNITDEDPPGCFSCGLNNYDPTTYDVPGRFGYLRISYRR
ncbi:TonB-dependent receptor domain-containing protein [Terricaulis sp.]|uniref:TonB-dependent receptor domain-containing protein n=1 Tax=Terricaulis sp. TaxID=2768686 RepID=UPI003784C3F9